MRLNETAATILIVGLLLGCGSGGPKATAPAGSTLTSNNEQTAAELQRTYRASHPGQQVGYVNAVDPGLRIISVAGITPEAVRPGSIMSILTAGGGTVQAVAYAHDYGYVQLRYEPLGPGQSAPSAGELAIWNPGGQVVIPEVIPPVGTSPTAVPQTPIPPARSGASGANATSEPLPPPPPVVPATTPADQQSLPATRPLNDVESPATQPATPPTSTETPPPPPPVTPSTMPRPAPDLNK